MSDFEQDLRNALCRREPPPGFAGRVLARLPDRRAWPRWLAVAAMLLIAVVGLSMWELERRQQRLAAERARTELIRALEITTNTLETTRVMLHRQLEGKTI